MKPICAFMFSIVVAGSAASAAEPPAFSAMTYNHDATTLSGFVARPNGMSASASRAGIVVLPEWWGCTDYAQRRARELAAAGYIALAADLYGSGKTTNNPAEAAALAQPFYSDPALMAGRARAAVTALSQQSGVDPARIAVIGFCFGGSAALQLARAGDPIKAVIAFHPGLKTAAPATAAITARILVLHGGSDQFVPPADVATFMSEMIAIKANWNLQVYGTALHAFSNRDAGITVGKGLPIAYDAVAERAAITAMYSLLTETIGGR